MSKRDMRRLAALTRRLARAVARGWADDERILRAEIETIIARVVR